MHYRRLGKTGMDVSVIGLGSAQLGSSNKKYAVKIVDRAIELGVNYFDTAQNYSDSEIKLGLALNKRREDVYVSTKTEAKTKKEAWQHINDSLQRLQTSYLDNYHLHNILNEEDLRTRLNPGGALEALIEAKDQGVINHIGCTSHISRLLVKAIDIFDFEIILIPMNIVERDPLKELIPLCLNKKIGISIMKPVATGLLPAQLALKWLLSNPIDTAVPGATTIEEVEENSLVGHLDNFVLSARESEEADLLLKRLDNIRCRICGECEPCPVKIPIGSTLGTDVRYNHYRTMGPEGFKTFPWSAERVRQAIKQRKERISQIKSCNECGSCETKCPHNLPIISMLKDMIEPMEDMVQIWENLQK